MGVRPDVEFTKLNQYPISYRHEMYGSYTWIEQKPPGELGASDFSDGGGIKNRVRDDFPNGWNSTEGVAGFTNVHDYYVTGLGTVCVTGDSSVGGIGATGFYGPAGVLDGIAGEMYQLNLDPEDYKTGPNNAYVVGKMRKGRSGGGSTQMIGQYVSAFYTLPGISYPQIGYYIDIFGRSPAAEIYREWKAGFNGAYMAEQDAYGVMLYDWTQFIGGYHVHSYGDGVPHQHFKTVADYNLARARGQALGEIEIWHDMFFDKIVSPQLKSYSDFVQSDQGGAGVVSGGGHLVQGWPESLSVVAPSGFNTTPYTFASIPHPFGQGTNNMIWGDGINNILDGLPASYGQHNGQPKVWGNLPFIVGGTALDGGANPDGSQTISAIIFVGSDAYAITDPNGNQDLYAPTINADGTIAPPEFNDRPTSAEFEVRRVSHW